MSDRLLANLFKRIRFSRRTLHIMASSPSFMATSERVAPCRSSMMPLQREDCKGRVVDLVHAGGRMVAGAIAQEDQVLDELNSSPFQRWISCTRSSQRC